MQDLLWSDLARGECVAPGAETDCVSGMEQAAEAAAAQSNREISGYRIESISITDERQRHYQNKQGMAYQGSGQLGEGGYPGVGAVAGGGVYGEGGGGGLVGAQQYVMPDGTPAPSVPGHPQMVSCPAHMFLALRVCACVWGPVRPVAWRLGRSPLRLERADELAAVQGGMGQLSSTGSGGGLHWQRGLGNIGMVGQGGMPYGGQGGGLQVSLGMPGNAAYLPQYAGGMPANAMGGLGGSAQPGDWQRGGGTPGMAWPYRGSQGGGDVNAQAQQNAQNLNYQMLVNASLYQQQNQGFGGGNPGGLADMGLLPGGAAGYAGAGSGMPVPGASELPGLGHAYQGGSGGAGSETGSAPRQADAPEHQGQPGGGAGGGVSAQGLPQH